MGWTRGAWEVERVGRGRAGRVGLGALLRSVARAPRLPVRVEPEAFGASRLTAASATSDAEKTSAIVVPSAPRRADPLLNTARSNVAKLDCQFDDTARGPARGAGRPLVATWLS